MAVKKSYSNEHSCALDCGGAMRACNAAFQPTRSAVNRLLAEHVHPCPSNRPRKLGKDEPSSAVQTKSILAHPKSTVDLGLEPLIWGKNTLLKDFSLDHQHLFCPIMTRQWDYQNQKQTDSNQKFIPSQYRLLRLSTMTRDCTFTLYLPS